MKGKTYKGFTLIEILVVVALIAILATITIVAINPAKNFEDTRNAQRSSDVNSLLNAITQYTTDGKVLPTIDDCTTDWKIGTPILKSVFADKLAGGTASNDYMVALPVDPSIDPEDTPDETGYIICKTGTSRIQVAAPKAEGGKVIVVRR